MMKTGKHKISPQANHFNRDKLAEIFDTYHLPIYRSIYRRVGEVETARDLSADVFCRLLQAVQARKGPSRNVKAWLYRTAHNIVVDHYRRRHFRRHDPLYKDFAFDDLDPAQTAETHILAQSARHALNNLTPDQRQVISLKCLDGLSNKEVAAIMNKSTGAVKSLQHRALTALRRELKRIDTTEQKHGNPQQAVCKEKGMSPREPIPNGHQPLLTVTSSQ